MNSLVDFDASTPSPAPSPAERLIRQSIEDMAEVRGSQSRAVYLAIRAGIRLHAAKADAGHGEFLALLEKVGVNAMSASRYMRLAAHLRDNIAIKPNEFTLLISAQPRLTDGGTITLDARPTLAKRIAAWVDDRSLTEIYHDLGIQTRKRLPDKTPDAGEPPDAETPPTTEADNARWIWFGRNGKGGILTDLRVWALDQKAHAHLPEAERKEIAGMLTDVLKTVRATLK